MRNSTWIPYDVLPKIDLEQCTGCGLCVALCPTEAVVLIDGQAAITQPMQCTFCEVCESYCPVGAIGRPFIVVLATRSNQSEDAVVLSDLPPDQSGVA
jgi:ferredoxin